MITNQTNLRSYIIEQGAFPPELVTEIIDPSSFHFSEIKNGLLLVFARWSPLAILAVRGMREVVPSVLARSDGKLFVIDNDKLTASDMQRLFNRQLHGAGETFAVVSGQIVGQCIYSNNYSSLIMELAAKLLGSGTNR